MPQKRLTYYFCYFRNTVFDHKSPVHPVSESQVGSLSLTDKQRTKEQTRRNSCTYYIMSSALLFFALLCTYVSRYGELGTAGPIHQTSRIPRNMITGSGNPTFESYVEGK